MTKNKTVGRNIPASNLTSQLVSTVTDVDVTVESLRKDLIELGQHARQMIGQPARISGVLKNAKALQENLSVDEFKQLTDAAGVLVRDLQKYSADLDALRTEQERMNWASEDILELQVPAIYIHEQYQQWILSFTDVVLPISAILDGLIKVAAANQRKKKEA